MRDQPASDASPANSAGPVVSAEAPASAEPLTLYQVKRLQLAARALIDDELRPAGLTSFQYTVLTILQRREGQSSAELARRCFVRPQTMHELIQVLERRGIIDRREGDPDRRRRVITLTDAGRRLLGDCEAGIQALEERLLEGLTQPERQRFRDDLKRAIAALGDEARRRGGVELIADY